jgi:phenylpyruvate tautomerase PptA (4-oxalocrotonate tautomerase family)
MPLYTVMTQAGVLSGEAKAKFAGELTTLHSEYAGVPKNWVHIVFQDYVPGSGFTGGEASATAALTLLVRAGRSPEYKRELLKRLWKLFQDATGAPDDQSSSAFRSCRQVRQWRWDRSCRTWRSNDSRSGLRVLRWMLMVARIYRPDLWRHGSWMRSGSYFSRSCSCPGFSWHVWDHKSVVQSNY